MHTHGLLSDGGRRRGWTATSLVCFVLVLSCIVRKPVIDCWKVSVAVLYPELIQINSLGNVGPTTRGNRSDPTARRLIQSNFGEETLLEVISGEFPEQVLSTRSSSVRLLEGVSCEF